MRTPRLNTVPWYGSTVVGAMLVAFTACNDSTAPGLSADPRWALAWASDGSAAEYEASTFYSSTTDTSGDPIMMTRASTGTYAVRFPNLASRFGWKESIHVSAYGDGSPRRCRVASWADDGDDLVAQVRCHNFAGALADSEFDILMASAGMLQGRSSFMVSTNANGGVVPFSMSHSARSRLILSSRSSTGNYLVTFRGLAREEFVDAGPETIHVTSYGDGANWCKVSDWGTASNDIDFEARILCFAPNGTAADAQFSVLMLEKSREDANRFGFLWLDDQTTAGPTIPTASYSFNSSGAVNTANRTSTGVYTLGWVGLPNTGVAAETNLVTAYGADNAYCQVDGWGTAATTILCYDANGTAVNSQFTAIWIE